ncbi:hypothetical protein J1D01_03570 [Seonamhaeicola sp. NFXS20]|uniref:hypothetical protein n=1 Tax=Seonamhaeicola sp. NFXS20 TaxID=2816959 RepID=UPI003B8E9570
MARNKRRHNTGFGYIGFGNNQSLFNQKSTQAFSSLKEKLDNETHYHFKLNFTHKKLTKQEKDLIKNKIRRDEKIKTRKTIIVFCFFLLLFWRLSFI